MTSSLCQTHYPRAQAQTDSVGAWEWCGRAFRNGVYTIDFQVWRPSPSVGVDGCYSLVGLNHFENIRLADGGLVNETTAPSNTITVQPGDEVGYFVTLIEDVEGGIIQLDGDYHDEAVWYNQEGSLVVGGGESMPCILQVEINRTLSSFTNIAPVLSVNIRK